MVMPAENPAATEARAALVASAPTLRGENEQLRGLVRTALAGLSRDGAMCAACEAEPGVNIDCAVCKWITEAENAAPRGES